MVTWSQLGAVATVLFSAVLGLTGITMIFGGMMSSAPVEGTKTSERGCALFVAAIALLVLGLLVLT